jgi:hypothetical protein
MPFRVTRVAAAALAACAAVAITGSAIAMPSGRSSAATQITGSELSALLVPASALPHGYKLESNSRHDSGSRLETAAAKYDLARMSCAAINDDNGKTGFGESALAEAGYFNSSGLHGTGVFQQVYQFRAAKAAASFWHGLRAIIIRCPGFGEAASIDPGKIVQRVEVVRYRGGEAFEVDMTETKPQAGTVNTVMLFVPAGDDVFTVGVIGYSRPVPADPSTRTLMSKLVARVSAAG